MGLGRDDREIWSEIWVKVYTWAWSGTTGARLGEGGRKECVGWRVVGGGAAGG